jgi:hypothetical protein
MRHVRPFLANAGLPSAEAQATVRDRHDVAEPGSSSPTASKARGWSISRPAWKPLCFVRYAHSAERLPIPLK